MTSFDKFRQVLTSFDKVDEVDKVDKVSSQIVSIVLQSSMNEYFQISLYLKTFSSLTVPQKQEQLSNIKDCLRKLAVKNAKNSQTSKKKCQDFEEI